MSDHHKARRLALQGLCVLDVQGEAALDSVNAFIGDSRQDPDTVEEARRIMQAAFAARGQADALLSGESRHWSISRMALVDRNILRLTVWELMTDRAPPKVVIAEALKLAKEFASAESGRFINGVLDAAAARILSRDAGDAEDKNIIDEGKKIDNGGEAEEVRSKEETTQMKDERTDGAIREQ